jgi:hypothetical protein
LTTSLSVYKKQPTTRRQNRRGSKLTKPPPAEKLQAEAASYGSQYPNNPGWPPGSSAGASKPPQASNASHCRRPRAPAPDPNQERFEVFWSWIPKRISVGRGTKTAAWQMWNAKPGAPGPAQARAMTRLLRCYLDDPLDDYEFHDQRGEPLVRPADLVRFCWAAYGRRVELAEVLAEAVPELG